jgi:hypothetical protein
MSLTLADRKKKDQRLGADPVSELNFLVITANGANAALSEKTMQAVLKNHWGDDELSVDAVFVAGQEEDRDMPAAKVAKKVLNLLPGKVRDENKHAPYRRSENTTWTKATEGLSCLSLSCLSKHDMVSHHAGQVTHRSRKGAPYKNKGFHFSQMTIAGEQRIDIAGGHADSNSDATRLHEMRELMARLTGGIHRTLTADAIILRAPDLLLCAADFNYRDVKKEGQEEVLDPFNWPATEDSLSPARHFQMHGLEAGKFGDPAANTYVGDHSHKLDDKKPSTNDAFDKKRQVGGGAELRYTQQGKLDRLQYQRTWAKPGDTNNYSQTIHKSYVIPNPDSDHDIVVTLITSKVRVANTSEKKFKRALHWVAGLIKDVASEEVIDRLLKTELGNQGKGKKHLAGVFNYYIRLKTLRLEGEYLRLQIKDKHKACKKTKASCALIGEDGESGLVKELSDVGTDLFGKHQKEPQDTPKQMIADKIEAAAKTMPTLMFGERIFSTLNWFYRLFTGKLLVNNSAVHIGELRRHSVSMFPTPSTVPASLVAKASVATLSTV